MNKILIIAVIALFNLSLSLGANTISVCTAVHGDVDTSISEYANLKLESMAECNDFIVTSDFTRLVLAARIVELSKSISPSNPPMVTCNLNIDLVLGDVMENELFSSCSFQVIGVGTTDAKAVINAFSKIQANGDAIASFFKSAHQNISTYYSRYCSQIISSAQLKSKTGDYAEALLMVSSLPAVTDSITELKCVALTEILKSKFDGESLSLYNEALTRWAGDKSLDGAKRAVFLLNEINPAASCYPDVLILLKEISTTVLKTEADSVAFKMRQYEDKNAFRAAIIEAGRALGASFVSNLSKSVFINLNKWW